MASALYTSTIDPRGKNLNCNLQYWPQSRLLRGTCIKFADCVKRTVKIETSTVEIEERGVKLRLTVVDTPGYGDGMDNKDRLHFVYKVTLHSSYLRKCYYGEMAVIGKERCKLSSVFFRCSFLSENMLFVTIKYRTQSRHIIEKTVEVCKRVIGIK